MTNIKIIHGSHWLFPGEDCTAGSRVYVQDSVYDKFIALLVEKVKSTKIGDGFDDTVTSGPIVSDWAARICSAAHGGLTQSLGRSRKPNSIRCGDISNWANKKVRKFWLAEKSDQAGGISWIPHVRLLTLIPDCLDLFAW